MKAESRAKKLYSFIKEIIDPEGRIPWFRKPDAILAISQEFQAVRREAIGECAKEALEYGNKVLAAKVFSQQIAKKICTLLKE